MRSTPLALALGLALSVPATAAPRINTADGQSLAVLDTVTVSATRTARALDEVPNTVTVMTREDLDRQLARDIKDLVRYEPGVSVTSSFGRFGLGGFGAQQLGEGEAAETETTEAQEGTPRQAIAEGAS